MNSSIVGHHRSALWYPAILISTIAPLKAELADTFLYSYSHNCTALTDSQPRLIMLITHVSLFCRNLKLLDFYSLTWLSVVTMPTICQFFLTKFILFFIKIVFYPPWKSHKLSVSLQLTINCV